MLTKKIEAVEATVLKYLKPIPEYRMLLTVPGIGPVIAWTIVLEAGELSRFANVGHFASYCRCVDSKRISNEKKKGENNRKNGNPYLAWAFFEAAHFAIQYLPAAKGFYERKAAQRNPIPPVATSKSPTRGRSKSPRGRTGRAQCHADRGALTRRAADSLRR